MAVYGMNTPIKRYFKYQYPDTLYRRRMNAVCLPPRSLPNGVYNRNITQNVSDDLVLQASDIQGILVGAGVRAYTDILSLSRWSNTVSFVDAIQGTFNIPGWTEIAFTSNLNSEKFATAATGRLYFYFPLGTTLEQARTLLAGIVIRYQLATPIVYK